jgi:hypothetical protein
VIRSKRNNNPNHASKNNTTNAINQANPQQRKNERANNLARRNQHTHRIFQMIHDRPSDFAFVIAM